MNIREEKPGDLEAVEALTYLAFENHPYHVPGAKPTEHLIVNRLRASGALTLSLVAEEGGVIVGHIAFSPVTVEGQACGWFGLGPVSVRPERQGQGIASQLIRQGLRNLEARGAEAVVLVGEPAYYGRFGFKANPDLVFPGVPAEYFVVLRLREDIKVPAGLVGFHKAFG
ncbi:GNAT family N-acetyltransferase [Marinobacterium sedimentorum]|uniref:GNAT family N-acetyltransferase n=1 Tax=Marinobacterium sedimentorum TaxID=2927804 RepID=UPI0020C6CC87|nr:N-acetyltransferase [Marinobacterium sedimentorum]MCP8689867.1 N-acetyltransferase [Marinobacterium sedimentorum]